MTRRTKIVAVGVVLAIGTGLTFVFRPSRLPVETAKVHRGTLQEVSEEEGKTRIHDHYIVAATVGGKLRRLNLHAGDLVSSNQVLAWIDPAPIDPRESAVLEARLRAARAAKQQADALAAKAQVSYSQAETDITRARELHVSGIISRETFDRALTSHKSARQELEAAQAAVESAGSHIQEAESALMVYESNRNDMPTQLRAPSSGRVLRIMEQSERVVAPGTPIVEIGYTPRLEIVADFLTREAVRIRPGMPVSVSDWGGDAPLRAHVRTVEPGAFTKVSALGVEEQRANVICDFDEGSEGLQDAYHVYVKVTTWQAPDVTVAPSSSVFRSGNDWAVFLVRDGKARKTLVKFGHRGEQEWEVLSGLTADDEVIIHPGAAVTDGALVTPVS